VLALYNRLLIHDAAILGYSSTKIKSALMLHVQSMAVGQNGQSGKHVLRTAFPIQGP